MNNCQSASGRDFIKQAAGADAWSDLQSAVLSELAASQKVMPAKGPLRCFGQARSLFLQPPATFLGPCLAQWLHYDGNKCAQEIRLPTDECLLHAARGHGSDLVSDAVKVRGRRLAVGHGMGHRPSAAIRGPRLTRIWHLWPKRCQTMMRHHNLVFIVTWYLIRTIGHEFHANL